MKIPVGTYQKNLYAEETLYLDSFNHTFVDGVRGMAKAQVVLRPVNLLKLDLLLRSKDVQAQRNRAEFAYRLALGTPPDVLTN